MTQIREILQRDPATWTIPNLGVAKVGPPRTAEEWRVLRYELQAFVADGSYADGLLRILESYLSYLNRDSQPAAWVSGFFGSGKSHLVRVLDALWCDIQFPDGARASGLVNLPPNLQAALKELRTRSAQYGGSFSAAGTLSAGGTSASLSFLSIVFAAAGLPESYPAASLVLWLRREGMLDAVVASLEAAGRKLDAVLHDMYVSDPLASAIISARPGFAASNADARKSIQAQFPAVDNLTDDEFIAVLRETLKAQSPTGAIPLSLIVLDELQQFLGSDPVRTLEVQQLVEACCSEFGSRLLFVATGQMALSATAVLQKLQDRFTVAVTLRDTDVDRVVRSVVLQKRPDKEPLLRQVLDRAGGEISRQLAGSAIAPVAADGQDLITDYPLLPSRRRFWDRVLRAMDTAGRSAKLRTQLRIILDATKEVADREVGVTVAADLIYDQMRDEFQASGALPRDTASLIDELDDATLDGRLQCRIAKVAFLIAKLPTDAARPIGVRATPDMIADLLVEDVRSDGPALRAAVPGAAATLARRGILIEVNGAYLLQTPTAAEWAADFEMYRREVEADEAWIASARSSQLQRAFESVTKGIQPRQGESKETRRFRLFYGDSEPRPSIDEIPAWIRDGWGTSEKVVEEAARQAGTSSPWIFVFVDRAKHDELRTALVETEAATRTIDRRAAPQTPEGRDARQGMASRREASSAIASAVVADIVRVARVYQAGGAEIAEPAAEPAVGSSLVRAIDNAVLRLYPEFGTANAKGWARVVEVARQGNPAPLSAVGYRGEAEGHPVAKAILAFLPPGGRLGQAIRKQFTAPPYGWPQDAIDGCLLALVSEGKVEARRNGSVVAARDILQNVLGAFEFRSQTVVARMSDKLAVRSLAQDLAIKIQGFEDLELPRLIIGRLHELAAAAGGDAPLPAPPSVESLRDLETQSGPALLVATAEAVESLRRLAREWKFRSESIPVRRAEWDQAQRLQRHGPNLVDVGDAGDQLISIQTNRALLAEPDPIRPVIDHLCDVLRRALLMEWADFNAARESGVADLNSSQEWRGLDPGAKNTILQAVGLGDKGETSIGTISELLSALDSTPIRDWAYRTQAVPAQVGRALARAAASAESETVEIARTRAVIRERGDLDKYVADLRDEVLPHLEAHRTVIL